MQFVDYDPVAASHAADTCRASAAELRAAANLLDTGVGDQLAAWAGDSRLNFDDVAAELAADLRTEAGHLEDTADEIDTNTRRAYDADGAHRQAHEERLRQQQEATQCTPTGR